MPPPRPASPPEAAAPPAAVVPTPAPATPRGPKAAPPLAAPAAAAPSGVLFGVGLKSDLPELVYGPPGRRWLVAASGRAEILRGPLRLRPEGRRGVSFQVQAGAFSQEEPARQLVDRLAREFATPGTVAFSADRGVYRALLGSFPDRASADSFAGTLRAAGQDALPVEGSAAAAPGAAGTILVAAEDGAARRLASPVGIYSEGSDGPVLWESKPYRGSLRVLVNARGTLNVVNRVDLEEYLYGVVPAEMGPKRFDELEALKAQSVAARTYAMAHRGQFESEGYDLCATPKCQVYSGLSSEDPLSNAAVDATRGLALASGGRFADALFISTCGGRTEDVENVFGETPVPYLVSVACGELATTELPGAAVDRRAPAKDRNALEWRGYVLTKHAGRRRATRAGALETAQRWAGVPVDGAPPSTLHPSAVYPSIVSAFALAPARAAHLLPGDERYYAETPAVFGRLAGAGRDAYDFLLRFRFGAGESLPAPDRNLTEEEYAGLLLSAAMRAAGVVEGSGRFLRREGANVWVKTAEGRLGLPVDPELPLARRVGDRFLAASSLTLRSGDRLRWWKRGSDVVALWVELDAAGPSFERESSWTEWVRRVSGRELARRMAARVAGTEVRDIRIVRRSASGRAIEIRVVTDAAEATMKRFDLRQALEMPDALFTVQRVRGPQGEAEFLFLGRGWGHGVGMCQNGAYGMALAGATYDRILTHYYTGIQIVPASTLSAAPPSTR
ncbi:MAG: SpoIID/LytB domain-containing protein [Acidobacteria bacterium]|nr:SpoIID/LytB domain-containing protein [Acidobacteriota bacterium]